jgi:hypothetical protein
MGASKVKKVRCACLRVLTHGTVRGILEFVLILGTAYFLIGGALILVFRTDSYWMAVESDSMKHEEGEVWRTYFEDKSVREQFFKDPNDGDLTIPIKPEDIRVFDTSKFPIQGGFERGDLLVVQGVGSVSDISVGDVLIIDRSPWDPIPLTHRVLARWEEDGEIRIATKGDGNPRLIREAHDMGPPNQATGISPERIVGKVIFVVPELGHISLWFQGR